MSEIWISYSINDGFFGYTDSIYRRNIAICELSFAKGQEFVLGTLIHELAHVGGAPGGNSHAAEQAILECGLGRRYEHELGVDSPQTIYNPTIVGSVRVKGRNGFA